jgi:hypothetical protein
MPAPTALSEIFTDWGGFEQFVAELHKTGSVVVEHNVTLKGRSGASRQVDVLVHHKEGLYEHLIVVECKFRKSPIKREHVDSMATTIREVGASRGVIFSTKGFQRGAIEQAKHENINLYKVRLLEDDEWGKPGRNFDLWLQLITISIGSFEAPGSMCVGPAPNGPLALVLGNSGDSQSSHTPLIIPGNPPTTLEALLIETARKSARNAYRPTLINFDGAEEGDLKRKLKVRIKPKLAAEVHSMGAILLLPEITYELGIKISQSRIQIDRGADYTFVLAVEDCVNKAVTIASRASVDEYTSFAATSHETSTEEPFQNGSISALWLSGMTPFEEFANVPLSTDGPSMQISLSSLGE